MDEVKLLQDLVSIYSPTGNEKNAVEFLVDAMSKAGMNAFVDEAGNAVGTCGFPERNVKELLLIGHIDTVPGKIKITMNDGNLYGRGSVDAKGPLTAMVAAVSSFITQKKLHIVVVGAVGEEGDSRGAKYILKTMKPNFAIVGEPGGWESLVIGYKGKLSFEYSITKVAKHSAFPEENTADTCLTFIHRLREYSRTFSKPSVFDSLSMSVRCIETKIEDFSTTVTAIIDFRTPTGFDEDAFIRAAIEWAKPGTIRIIERDPPLVSGKNNILVRSFISAIRNLGGQPTFKKKTGTADMNLLGNGWNIPILTYGPGDSNFDHTPDEHITIDEYRKSIEVLRSVIGQLSAL